MDIKEYLKNTHISSWSVYSVTDMNSMFYRATSFNQDISKWNVSNVTDMKWMFFNNISFNQDISNWDVSNVIDMRHAFIEQSLLIKIYHHGEINYILM